MSLVLAVDIGTGSCRSALYNQELQRLSTETVEYTTQYPQPDWAEQDPEVIFVSILQAIEKRYPKATRIHKKSSLSLWTARFTPFWGWPKTVHR